MGTKSEIKKKMLKHFLLRNHEVDVAIHVYDNSLYINYVFVLLVFIQSNKNSNCYVNL